MCGNEISNFYLDMKFNLLYFCINEWAYFFFFLQVILRCSSKKKNSDVLPFLGMRLSERFKIGEIVTFYKL